AGEFQRKVRTLAGNFQLLQLAPWIIGRENRLLFQFVSHKLLRLLIPVSLLMTLLCSAALAPHAPLYAVALATQIGVYALATISGLHDMPGFVRIAGAARAFCMLNAAVVVGFYKFLFSRPLWHIWVVNQHSKRTVAKERHAIAAE